jgi:hypothetical protein
LLDFASAQEAFRAFFGLVVRDLQIRVLLGDAERPDAAAINGDAARATEQFFALYGAEQSGADPRPRNT